MAEEALQFVSLSIRVLSLSGVWPLEHKETTFGKIKKLARTTFVYLHWMSFIFGQFYILYTEIDDISIVSDVVSLLSTYILTISKITLMMMKKTKLQKLLDLLQCEKFHPKTDDHRNIINSYIQNVKKLHKIFYFICSFTLIFYLSFPLIEMSKEHPSPIKFPYIDVLKYPFYEITYVFEVVSIINTAMVESTVDILIPSFMSQAIAQLDYLHKSLENIYEKEIVENKSMEMHNIGAIRHLKKAVLHHRLIKRYVKCISEAFDIIIFIQYVISGFIICFTAVSLLLTSPFEQPFKFITSLSFMVVMLTEIFMLCWFGNEIMMKSDHLDRAIYNTMWIDSSSKFKQNMKIFMLGVKKPIIISVGSVFLLNLKGFGSILNTSYSYFALVRNVYNRKTEQNA